MSWIQVVDTLTMPVGYYVMFAMMNQVMQPRRGALPLLGATAYFVLATLLVRRIEDLSNVAVLLQLVITYLPLFVLYPRERFFRKIYCGSTTIVGEVIAVPLSTLIVNLMTGRLAFSIAPASTPIDLLRNGIELTILFPAVHALLMPLRRGQDAGVHWGGYALFVMSQSAMAFVAVLALTQNPELAPSQFYVLIACVAVCAAADVALYRTMRRDIQAAQARAENEALRQTHRMAMQHNRELQDQLKQTAILRHDVRHHLGALRALLASDPARADLYLGELIQAQAVSEPAIFCENPAINAALHAKALQARALGVALDVNLRLPAELGIDDVDLVGIFSNLLDNALEACAPLGASQAVTLGAAVKSGHLVIRCKNPCPHPSAFTDGLPETTKPHGHGIGCRSIRTAARKHNGDARFEWKEGWFIATVSVPLNR